MDTTNLIELAATVLANIVIITTVIKNKLRTELSDIKATTKNLTTNNGCSDNCSALTEVVSKIYDKVCKLETSVSQIYNWKLTWMELSEFPVFIANKTGGIVWVNSRFLKRTGTTYQEIEGTNWYSIIHNEDRAETIKLYEASVESRTSFYHKFRVVNQQTKEVFPVTCRSALLTEANGDGFIGVLYTLDCTAC